MSPRLAGCLNAERHQKVVGRTGERALFGFATSATELPFHVLYVFGPGGVGKTTLLGEFVDPCEQVGLPAAFVDAHNLEPSPNSLIRAMWAALSLDAQKTLPFKPSHTSPDAGSS